MKSAARPGGIVVQVSEVDGDLVTLSIAAAPLARMLAEESNAEVIKAALTQTIGGTWRVTVAVAGGPANGVTDSTDSSSTLRPARWPRSA